MVNTSIQIQILALLKTLNRIAEQVEELLDQRLAENTERRIHG